MLDRRGALCLLRCMSSGIMPTTCFDPPCPKGASLMPLKLTYPPTHSLDDIRPFFDGFRKEYPDLYSEWYQLWLDYRINPPSPDVDQGPHPLLLRCIKATSDYFRSKNVPYDDDDALVSAFASFRKLVGEEVTRALAQEQEGS